MHSSLDRLSIEGLEFWSVRLTLVQVMSASSFSRPFTAAYIVAVIPLFGTALEVIEKLRHFARRSVSTWVNCLEDILITHIFLFVILVAFYVTLFLLINSLNFCIFLFFDNSEDLLYKFSWIFSTRWNSSGVIDSKILLFNCLTLFLRLSGIAWLICICSSNNSLPAPACSKIILLHSVLILSCRSFNKIL